MRLSITASLSCKGNANSDLFESKKFQQLINLKVIMDTMYEDGEVSTNKEIMSIT